MANNKWELTLPVRYDDLAKDLKASSAAMMRYMQHTAIMHSDGIGHSLENLFAMGRCWVMLTWDYEEYERPKVGEKIRVCTEAEGFGSCFGYRHFMLFGENGALYAKAYTVWAFYDIENMRPARVTPEVAAAYGLEGAAPMRIRPEKITVPEHTEEVMRVRIQKSDTDTNRHVNNVRYLDYGEDALPEGFSFSRTRVYYEHAATVGDIAVIRRAKTDKGYWVGIESADGKRFAAMEFCTDQRD